MIRQRNILLAALLTLSMSPDLSAQSAYSVQAFGPQTSQVYPRMINEAGDVAGYHYGSGYTRAFLYRSGVFTDLGTLGGSYSYPEDINASGVVVGYSYIANDNTYH